MLKMVENTFRGKRGGGNTHLGLGKPPKFGRGHYSRGAREKLSMEEGVC